jgi:hypothetical protein
MLPQPIPARRQVSGGISHSDAANFPKAWGSTELLRNHQSHPGSLPLSQCPSPRQAPLSWQAGLGGRIYLSSNVVHWLLV